MNFCSNPIPHTHTTQIMEDSTHNIDFFASLFPCSAKIFNTVTMSMKKCTYVINLRGQFIELQPSLHARTRPAPNNQITVLKSAALSLDRSPGLNIYGFNVAPENRQVAWLFQQIAHRPQRCRLHKSVNHLNYDCSNTYLPCETSTFGGI